MFQNRSRMWICPSIVHPQYFYFQVFCSSTQSDLGVIVVCEFWSPDFSLILARTTRVRLYFRLARTQTDRGWGHAPMLHSDLPQLYLLKYYATRFCLLQDVSARAIRGPIPQCNAK